MTIGMARVQNGSMHLTLDKFGRIVIPKAVRRRLGLEPGTRLRLEVGERGIVLEPLGEEAPLVEKDGLLVSTATLDADREDFDVVEGIRELRRSRSGEIGA